MFLYWNGGHSLGWTYPSGSSVDILRNSMAQGWYLFRKLWGSSREPFDRCAMCQEDLQTGLTFHPGGLQEVGSGEPKTSKLIALDYSMSLQITSQGTSSNFSLKLVWCGMAFHDVAHQPLKNLLLFSLNGLPFPVQSGTSLSSPNPCVFKSCKPSMYVEEEQHFRRMPVFLPKPY